MLLSLACEAIAPADVEINSVVENSCLSDSDCKIGHCSESLGSCIADEPELNFLLLEFLPQSTDRGFGGFRFFQYVRSEPESEILLLSPPPRVSGNIDLRPPGDSLEPGCEPREVTIKFSPVEGHLGLDVVRYTVTSTLQWNSELAGLRHTYELPGLPEGIYDISWQDAQLSNTPPRLECEIVPRFQRGVHIQRVNGKVPDLHFASPPVRLLRVTVPWSEALEGWQVDVVHPITGERLSTTGVLSRSQLGAAENGELRAVTRVRLGEVVGDDYVGRQKELLRLRPPANENRPTVLMELELLELFTPGEVPVPEFHPSAPLVHYKAWVWKDAAPETAVPGFVTFEASTLAEVPQNRRLSLRVPIGKNGQVEAELPPGHYDLRVRPTPESGFSAFDTSLDVWPPPKSAPSGTQQAGHVISVPESKVLSGKLVLPVPSSPMNIIVEAAGVPRTGVSSLQGRKRSVPRNVVTLVTSSRGNFTLTGADCGRCEETSGARYDLRVLPPAGSGLPWFVRPNVEVFQDHDFGALKVEAPFLYERKLEFPVPSGRTDLDGSFPNALIRAYALLDEQGLPILDGSLQLCSQRLKSGSTTQEPCISRAVQIAETRSGADGRFRLFLPPTLSPTPVSELD